MMQTLESLQQQIQTQWGESITDSRIACNELTITLAPSRLLECSRWLRDELQFEQLVDACGVDYLQYGCSEWDTQGVTATGFDRAVDSNFDIGSPLRTEKRFAVVYHLLSVAKNYRLRVRVFPEGDPPLLDSIIAIWPSVNWYEREAFDLYGILFNGHPDLRRILTDYGFIGYPFRKDFPLSGKVEVRYDAELGRVIYEPVDIVPRVLEPKVIPKDNRYKEISKEKNQ